MKNEVNERQAVHRMSQSLFPRRTHTDNIVLAADGHIESNKPHAIQSLQGAMGHFACNHLTLLLDHSNRQFLALVVDRLSRK